MIDHELHPPRLLATDVSAAAPSGAARVARLFAVLTDLGASGPVPVWSSLPSSSGLENPPNSSTEAESGTLSQAPVQAPDLDTSVLSVVSTSPSDGAVLMQSPTDLLITFNQPFDPFSLNFGDIVLERVGSDGTATPLDPSIYTEPLFLTPRPPPWMSRSTKRSGPGNT